MKIDAIIYFILCGLTLIWAFFAPEKNQDFGFVVVGIATMIMIIVFSVVELIISLILFIKKDRSKLRIAALIVSGGVIGLMIINIIYGIIIFTMMSLSPIDESPTINARCDERYAYVGLSKFCRIAKTNIYFEVPDKTITYEVGEGALQLVTEPIANHKTKETAITIGQGHMIKLCKDRDNCISYSDREITISQCAFCLKMTKDYKIVDEGVGCIPDSEKSSYYKPNGNVQCIK